MITSEAGKTLIQTCLNSPDIPAAVPTSDQRMSATGFEVRQKLTLLYKFPTFILTFHS